MPCVTPENLPLDHLDDFISEQVGQKSRNKRNDCHDNELANIQVPIATPCVPVYHGDRDSRYECSLYPTMRCPSHCFFLTTVFFSPGTPKMNWGLLISKLIAGTATLFLFWLIVQCPCKRLLCCHLPNVWVTLAVLVGTIVFVNGFQWSDASCLVQG